MKTKTEPDMTKTKIKSITSRRFLFRGALPGKIKLILPMICCAALGAHAAKAAKAGTLDPTFGSGGKEVVLQYQFASVPFANNTTVKLQPDGRIVVAGPIFDTFGVVRFLPTGQLDSSFGVGGVMQNIISNQDTSAPQDLAIQPDGKIVVVGGAESLDARQNFVALGRLNPDGSLDTTFGTGGSVLTPPPPTFGAAVYVVLLQPDGKIVLGGTFGKEGQRPPPSMAMVQRYNADGSLDASFGSSGILLLQDGVIRALALQTDGKILVNIESLQPVLIERLLPDGTIDPSHTAGTIATTAHTGPSTFQPDGRFVLANSVQDGPNGDTDLQTLRFTSDGVVDPSFASPVIDFGGSRGAVSTANAIALQVDGKVLVGGVSFGAFGLERLNTDGTPDPGFGKSGGVTTAFSSKFFGVMITSLVVQPDGKILAVGLSGDSSLALARYLP